MSEILYLVDVEKESHTAIFMHIIHVNVHIAHSSPYFPCESRNSIICY